MQKAKLCVNYVEPILMQASSTDDLTGSFSWIVDPRVTLQGAFKGHGKSLWERKLAAFSAYCQKLDS
jgi:hypothetical protein